MSRVWLEAFLGKIGIYTLNIIQEYYVFIVPVIALYGIFLAIATYNFKRIEKQIDLEIVAQSKKIISKMPGISYVSLVEKIEIPWDDIVYKYSFFPYISQEADFWVSRAYSATIRKLILSNNNKIKFILRRNGITFTEDEQGIRKNIYLDYIQRITKKRI